MAGTSLTLRLFHRLSILPRQMIASINQYSLNRIHQCTPNYCTASSASDSSEVEVMEKLLKDKFPRSKSIIVEDISGGCGQMYEVSVESVEFSGLTVVNQHKLVNEALKEKIKKMHGIIIHTTVPPESEK